MLTESFSPLKSEILSRSLNMEWRTELYYSWYCLLAMHSTLAQTSQNQLHSKLEAQVMQQALLLGWKIALFCPTILLPKLSFHNGWLLATTKKAKRWHERKVSFFKTMETCYGIFPGQKKPWTIHTFKDKK